MSYGQGRTPNDVDDHDDRPQTDRMRQRDGSARPAAGSRLGRIPAQRLPRLTAANRDDMMNWLQGGGWRIVAAVAAVILLLLLFMMWRAGSNNTDSGVSGQGSGTSPLPTFATSGNETGTGFQSDITPVPEQSQAAPGTRFSVINTGVEGLFLRPQPNTVDVPLETLPEGTVITQIGEDSVQPDRTWKNVQSPTGQTGWVAAEYLQQVP